MRAIYTLEIEDFTDLNPEHGYRVTIHEHGKNIGDGVGHNLSTAMREALRESGVSK